MSVISTNDGNMRILIIWCAAMIIYEADCVVVDIFACLGAVVGVSLFVLVVGVIVIDMMDIHYKNSNVQIMIDNIR